MPTLDPRHTERPFVRTIPAELTVAKAADLAFVEVLEGREQGRAEYGWYLGLAHRGHLGYFQVTNAGRFATMAEAQAEARARNEQLGHDEITALRIVLSTLGGPRRTLRRPRNTG